WLYGKSVVYLGSGQYHLAVAGGCASSAATDVKAGAPTCYREVVLTRSNKQLKKLRRDTRGSPVNSDLIVPTLRRLPPSLPSQTSSLSHASAARARTASLPQPR